jgi:hypothetical protein
MKQGYNSRLDESLGARNGKKTQGLKDRRDESKGAEEGAGKRAYSAVSTMDKSKKRKVTKTNKDGVKTRQVSKNGVVKKTVTRTKGGVEKEIERGNKRIEVQKYKNEGVKNRTVINMKKNNSSDLKQNPKTGKMSIKGTPVKDLVKNSVFRNLPSSMVKEAAKPENNVLPADRMDARQQKANQPMINKLNKMSLKQRKENK